MDLITLEEFKTVEQMKKTEDDVKLTHLITYVSALIKSYCNISFVDYYSTPKVEHITNLNASATVILLKEWPVKDVILIEVRQDDGSYQVLNPSEYFIDYNTDSIVKRSFWPYGEAGIKVTYTGGYPDVPEDIKICAINLVNHYFKEEFKERRTQGSATLDYATGGRSVEQPKWPNHVMRVLEMYKNG